MSMTCPVCAIGRGGGVAVGGFLWTCVPPNSVESTAVLLVQTYRACSRGPLSLVRLQGQGREELLMLSLGREGGACWCLTSHTLAEF